MRWLVLVTLIALASPAHADDGYYFQESLGGAAYRGELGRYDGAPMFHFGFNVRRGPWVVEAFGAFTIPDFGYVDCYGSECAYAAKPQAALGMFGVDLKKRLRLLYLHTGHRTFERPGVFVSVHGGPRVIEGDEALANYHGFGLGGGATLEGDLWVIGYYVDVGADVMTLTSRDDTIHGSTPYIMFGGKVGWL
jgi:hypothetical protein